MKKLLIVNGPNINMLGIREKNLYGEKSYDALVEFCRKAAEAKDGKVIDIDFKNI